MKNKIISFFLVLIFSVFLFGCESRKAAIATEPTLVPTPITVEKPTYIVQRGDVDYTIQMTGRVAPVLQQELFFSIDGVVKEVFVSVGEKVHAGDLIARLDDPERYQAELANAELEWEMAKRQLELDRIEYPLLAAQATVDLLEASEVLENARRENEATKYPRVTDPLTLENMRGELESAKLSMDEAQQNFDDLSERPESDAHRQSMLQLLISARNTHYRALINLQWAEGKPTEEETNKAEAELILAQAAYDKAEAEVQRWAEDGIETEIHLSELKVESAEAIYTMALKALEDIELRAPFDGEIFALSILPGTSVSAYQAIAKIADPLELEIIGYINEVDDYYWLGIGQSVVIRLSSIQDHDISGSIIGLPISLSQEAQNNNDISVHFILDEPEIDMQLGETAIILVTVEIREDVLWLPPAGIRQFQNQDFVYVESDGVQRRVNIIKGLETNEKVEIISGLEEGQIVIGQ